MRGSQIETWWYSFRRMSLYVMMVCIDCCAYCKTLLQNTIISSTKSMSLMQSKEIRNEINQDKENVYCHVHFLYFFSYKDKWQNTLLCLTTARTVLLMLYSTSKCQETTFLTPRTVSSSLGQRDTKNWRIHKKIVLKIVSMLTLLITYRACLSI